jgi:hypothetical protein
VRWLHGRSVSDTSISREIDHGAEPVPRDREEVEAHIRMALAPAVGEMIHLGADARHLSADRPDVKRALELARKLGDGDPVDRLEPVFHDLHATLASPRIRHAVRAIAGVLTRTPGGTMDAERVKAVIVEAVRDPNMRGDISMPPRMIRVVSAAKS